MPGWLRACVRAWMLDVDRYCSVFLHFYRPSLGHSDFAKLSFFNLHVQTAVKNKLCKMHIGLKFTILRPTLAGAGTINLCPVLVNDINNKRYFILIMI